MILKTIITILIVSFGILYLKKATASSKGASIRNVSLSKLRTQAKIHKVKQVNYEILPSARTMSCDQANHRFKRIFDLDLQWSQNADLLYLSKIGYAESFKESLQHISDSELINFGNDLVEPSIMIEARIDLPKGFAVNPLQDHLYFWADGYIEYAFLGQFLFDPRISFEIQNNSIYLKAPVNIFAICKNTFMEFILIPHEDIGKKYLKNASIFQVDLKNVMKHLNQSSSITNSRQRRGASND